MIEEVLVKDTAQAPEGDKTWDMSGYDLPND